MPSVTGNRDLESLHDGVGLDVIKTFCYADSMKITSTLCLMIVGVALTMAGDVFLKRSNGWSSPENLALGLVFYFLGCFPVAFLFTRMQFGTVFIAWEAVTIILAMAVGHLVFGEVITQNKVADSSSCNCCHCAYIKMSRR